MRSAVPNKDVSIRVSIYSTPLAHTEWTDWTSRLTRTAQTRLKRIQWTSLIALSRWEWQTHQTDTLLAEAVAHLVMADEAIDELSRKGALLSSSPTALGVSDLG